MELREAIMAACRATGISPQDLRLALENIERDTNGAPSFNELLNAVDDVAKRTGG
jgi:hypothetical protein